MKKGRARRKCIPLIILIVAALVGSLQITAATAESPEKELVAKATHTVTSFHSDPGLDWFHKHVKEAKAVLILPKVYEGALIIGASGGEGVLLVQNEETGVWSNPAFYNAKSMSLGLKVGGKSSEVIVMVMTQKGLEAFFKPVGFEIGADLKAAMGPGSGTAGTPGGDIITFGKSKGLILGTSLVGTKISPDHESNIAYYEQAVGPKDILLKGTVNNPHAESLRAGITETTKKPE